MLFPGWGLAASTNGVLLIALVFEVQFFQCAYIASFGSPQQPTDGSIHDKSTNGRKLMAAAQFSPRKRVNRTDDGRHRLNDDATHQTVSQSPMRIVFFGGENRTPAQQTNTHTHTYTRLIVGNKAQTTVDFFDTWPMVHVTPPVVPLIFSIAW